ncbi:MAG TPA: AbrB/MazE/SpoVT family DNA-binding domain-containing protein [Deltaproteobacteria bacterium]|nr:AbrB/MazE/SpoVT family DNA-binding domain-containing protein [Deltaproteobacteria bacterium]
MSVETTKIGKRGTIVIPAELRNKYGFTEGSNLVIESLPEGVLLRPVITLPIEIYTSERKAEFLLNNAITPEEYAMAVKKVREMGLDSEKIPHQKPDNK